MGLGWRFMGSTHHTARTVGYSGESCTRRSSGFPRQVKTTWYTRPYAFDPARMRTTESESTAASKFKAAAKLAKVRREKECARDKERESERDFLLRSFRCVCVCARARAYTIYRLNAYITCIHYNIVYMESTYVIL